VKFASGRHAVRAGLGLTFLLATGVALDAHTARAAALGAVLGVDRCGISGDAPPNTEYNLESGLVAGVQGELGIGKDISVGLQPMYVRRRTEVKAADESNASGERLLELSLDYISVPVVVKFGAANGHTYVAGGVDLGFLNSARISGEGIDEDVKSLFNTMDLSALLGFGVVFPVGRPRLTAELRYVQGLVNLADGEAAGATQDLPNRFHSDGWQLTAGILFPLGGR
jgi:hypothetical protein